jgi:hypothetical protein
MFGWRSRSVAHPSHTSLVSSPPTKKALVAMTHRPTCFRPSDQDLRDETETQRHHEEHSCSKESDIPLHLVPPSTTSGGGREGVIS